MKYTKEQRLAIANAFRKAKRNLSRHTYICWALEAQKGEGAIIAKREVLSRLNAPYESYSLEKWLMDMGIRQYSIIQDMHEHKQLRLYRLRWLDALIEEFSK